MAKKVTGYIKLQIPAGQANPSPPVGPALGQQGVNIMEFCKAFNAQTQALANGKSNMVDVVTAVAETEVAVDAVVAVRDKVIAAYDEIMKMPI